MDSSNFEPLRIRAHLRTGVVSDRWLPLDGLLFYQANRYDLGPLDMTTPITNESLSKRSSIRRGR